MHLQLAAQIAHRIAEITRKDSDTITANALIQKMEDEGVGGIRLGTISAETSLTILREDLEKTTRMLNGHGHDPITRMFDTLKGLYSPSGATAKAIGELSTARTLRRMDTHDPLEPSSVGPLSDLLRALHKEGGNADLIVKLVKFMEEAQ